MWASIGNVLLYTVTFALVAYVIVIIVVILRSPPEGLLSLEEAQAKKQRLFAQLKGRDDVAGVGIRSRTSVGGGASITRYWLVIYLRHSNSKADLPITFEGVWVEHDTSGSFSPHPTDSDKPAGG